MGKSQKAQQTPGVAKPTETEQQTLSYLDNWTNALGRNLPLFMSSPEFRYGQDMSKWATDSRGKLTANLADSAVSGTLNPQWERNMTDTINRSVQGTMGDNLQDAASRGVVNSTYSSGMMDRLAKHTADSINDNYRDLYKLQNDTLGQASGEMDKMSSAAWGPALLPLAASQQYMQPLFELWSAMYGGRMKPGTENTVVTQSGGGFTDFLGAIAPAFKIGL